MQLNIICLKNISQCYHILMYVLGFDQKYVLEILKPMSVCLNVYQQIVSSC